MGLMDTLKGMFGKAKEQGAELAEKAQPYMEKAKEQGAELAEKASPYLEKTKDFAQDAVEKAGAKLEEFRDKAGSSEAAEAAGGAVDHMKETASEVIDTVAEKAGDVAGLLVGQEASLPRNSA